MYMSLILLHSEQPKLYRVLAVLSAIGLTAKTLQSFSYSESNRANSQNSIEYLNAIGLKSKSQSQILMIYTNNSISYRGLVSLYKNFVQLLWLKKA